MSLVRTSDLLFQAVEAPTTGIFERLLSYLFPPRTLSELGAVGYETFQYHYRQNRNLSHDAPIPGKYSYGARLGKVVEGEPKPVYQRGTRASRWAQSLALALFVTSVASAQVQYPQTVKTGRGAASVSLTVPGDVQMRTDNANSPLKRTQTTYYVSKSLEANIAVTCVEYKDVSVVRPRLTEYLEQFIASYGSVDHLATIKEDGRKGMSISTEIYHDRTMMRFTYVDSRVFADDTHLYVVTVETEVAPNKPLRTNELTEILMSMKVN